MKQKELITKWLKKGLSEDQIELRLRDLEVPPEAYDTPASPVTVFDDSQQGVLNRVVKTIDTVDDKIVVEADKAEKSAIALAKVYTDSAVGLQNNLIVDNKNKAEQNEKDIATIDVRVATAITASQSAETKADAAVAQINAVSTIANEAKFSAADAIVKADSAISEASSAQSVAGTAEIYAQEAKTAAAAADTKAETASHNASTALVVAGTKMQAAGNTGADGQLLQWSDTWGEPRWEDAPTSGGSSMVANVSLTTNMHNISVAFNQGAPAYALGYKINALIHENNGVGISVQSEVGAELTVVEDNRVNGVGDTYLMGTFGDWDYGWQLIGLKIDSTDSSPLQVDQRADILKHTKLGGLSW